MSTKLLLLGGASAAGKSTLCRIAEKEFGLKKYRVVWSMIEVAFKRGIKYDDVTKNWNALSKEAAEGFIEKIKQNDGTLCDTHFAIQIGMDNALVFDLPFEEDIDEPYIRGFGEPFCSKINDAVDELYYILLRASPQDLLERRQLREQQGIRSRSLNPVSILKEAYFESKYFDEAYKTSRRSRSKLTERYTIDTSSCEEKGLRSILFNILSRKVILVRHGDTQWNLEDKFTGQTDLELADEGEEQAKELSQKIADFYIERIYHSPLRRTRETAELIAKYHPESKLVEVPELTERNFGEWEGKNIGKIVESQGGDARNFFDEAFSPPSGESLPVIKERVKGFYDKIKSEKGNIVICSHFTPLGYLISFIEGLDRTRITKEVLQPPNFRIYHF